MFRTRPVEVLLRPRTVCTFSFRSEFLLTTPSKPYSLQVLILAILAMRMHLQLWHSDVHVHGSDSLDCISMSDTPPADRTV
jgi:hypothetical protein